MRGQESGSHADLNAVSGLVKPSSVLFSLLNHHYIFPSILPFFYPLTTPTPRLGFIIPPGTCTHYLVSMCPSYPFPQCDTPLSWPFSLISFHPRCFVIDHHGHHPIQKHSL